MQRKVMSMCVSIDYCKGYNDAVDTYNQGIKIHVMEISMKRSREYCNGWNDAVLESRK